MGKPKRRWVRQPRVDLRGDVDTHGPHKPVRIVIHTTECNDAPGIRELQAVLNFWQRQDRGLGAHVLIDKDGASAKAAEFNQVCWAVKGANTGTIHFELIGFARFLPQVWWLRIRQLNKLAKWIAYLNLSYGIPIERSIKAGIAGHYEFPGNDHTDPGKFFPWKYVLRRARQFRVNGWT